MTWASIALMLGQYAFPFVDKVVTQWMSNPNSQPTQDEWNTLKAMAAQTAKTQMLSALSRAGIDPASAQGQALLAQVPA